MIKKKKLTYYKTNKNFFEIGSYKGIKEFNMGTYGLNSYNYVNRPSIGLNTGTQYLLLEDEFFNCSGGVKSLNTDRFTDVGAPDLKKVGTPEPV